ncbi:MAG: diguanylate cyclase (GGDEF)-like protein, partial [Paracoccaceae bacterium]
MAFGGLMLLIFIVVTLIDRATDRMRLLDQTAVAIATLGDEMGYLSGIALATVTRPPAPSDRDVDAAQMEIIANLIHLLDAWRDRAEAKAFVDEDHGDRIAVLRTTVTLMDAIHQAQRLLTSHPGGARDYAVLLATAAEVAADATGPVIAHADRLAADGAGHVHLWHMAAAGALFLSTALIGLLLVRPLALSHTERGLRLAELERLITHGALHDPLTGLPNRRYLTDHLTRVLAAAGRGGRVAAALHLNLDRFKAVNDSLGNAAGDRVLRRCATVMRSETRKGDFLSRIGADEFVIILSEVTTPEEVVRLAVRLIEALVEPIIIEGIDVRTGASIGVAMAEPNRLDADRLLTNVGLALADAKDNGRGRYAIYTDGRRIEFEQRRRIAVELRDALALDELEPFFQPQVCARTGRPLGFEALVRWRHPKRGLLTPVHFLDIAQETGLIEEIGEMVTRRSLAALAIWRSMGLPAERISLNISAKELRDAGFVDKLAWDVDAAGLEPRNIGIEILESVLIDDDNDPVIRNV